MPPLPPPPGPPPREALDYFGAKGLKVGFDHTDVWREEHLAAFTVAKVMERDILATVRGSVERALEQGQTLREWRKGIEGVLDKSGWTNYFGGATQSRFKKIYDTNMRTARAAGQYQRIQRTKEFRPFLVYRLGPSQRHRPEHELLDGIVLPVDDPFWSGAFPPNGFGCKCWTRQVSGRQAERLGGVSPRPDMTPQRHVHPKTGEVEFVQKGVDPGWDYSPGDRMAAYR
jgi:SPP1 gp7 family putative phage head morphogenesis protein